MLLSSINLSDLVTDWPIKRKDSSETFHPTLGGKTYRLFVSKHRSLCRDDPNVLISQFRQKHVWSLNRQNLMEDLLQKCYWIVFFDFILSTTLQI